MFIPHVMVPHRRDGRKRSPRQRLGAVLGAVIGSLASAIIGVGFSRGSRVGMVAVSCVIAGLAIVGGIVLAKVIGRQGKV
jgi:hypothetical protein